MPRPEGVEPDPRTDGVGDGGENELPAPDPVEIARRSFNIYADTYKALAK